METNQLNDVIVDLDIAKKLRAKGFDEPTNLYYLTTDLPYVSSGLRNMKEGMTLNHNKFDDFIFSAPTYKQAINWLIKLVDNLDFKEFEFKDWECMHDCILSASWDDSMEECLDLSVDELKKLFKELPEDLQEEARKRGMNYTPWMDSVYLWYKKNKIKA